MKHQLEWHLIEAGRTKRDAGAFFGEFPKCEWNKICISTNRKEDSKEAYNLSRDNQIIVATNVVLIKTEEDILLIDAGTPVMPDYSQWTGSHLRHKLGALKVTPKEVTKVILTSPDMDHAGGIAHHDRSSNLIPTFPKATIYYHESESVRSRARSIPVADHSFEIWDTLDIHPVNSVEEILPGLIVHPTEGPSFNGSIVEMKRGADRVLFMSDLCPTLHHTNPDIIPAQDDSPDQSSMERARWINKSMREGYMLVFGHGVNTKAGWMEERKEGSSFRKAL